MTVQGDSITDQLERRATMRSATELKQIFQEGWNTSTRVDNYVRNVARVYRGRVFPKHGVKP